jgi:hypothetical protein
MKLVHPFDECSSEVTKVICIPPHRRRNERQHAQGIVPLKAVTQSKSPIGRLPQYTDGRLGDTSQGSFGCGGVGGLLCRVPLVMIVYQMIDGDGVNSLAFTRWG